MDLSFFSEVEVELSKQVDLSVQHVPNSTPLAGCLGLAK